MDSVQLYAIEDTGPIQLPLPAQGRTIHDLFDNLPTGVYTALRTFDHNKFLHLEDHLERIDQSMAILGWNYRLNRSRLREALHRVTTNYPLPDARIRIDVLARSVPKLGVSSRELIALSPFEPIPESFYRQGVRVDLVRQLNRQQPLVKKADFVLKRRRYLAESPQAYERLMVDDRGNILEGTTSNFFAVCDGCLWTAGQEVLEGIARKIVLNMAAELQLSVRLEPVSIEELPRLDEAALSSSSRAIIPIIQVGDQIIGSGRPGPITAQLLAAYNAYVKQAIKPAVALNKTLVEVINMLKIGDVAPDFELFNAEGNNEKLSDYRSQRVVLFFYPKAGTSGCTTQACGFRDNFPRFEAVNATVIGVSPDKPAALAKWKAKENLPYTLLSDPEHEVAERYGVWGEKKMYGNSYMGIIRSHFVIDPEGIVADVQFKVSPKNSIGRALSSIGE